MFLAASDFKLLLNTNLNVGTVEYISNFDFNYRKLTSKETRKIIIDTRFLISETFSKSEPKRKFNWCQLWNSLQDDFIKSDGNLKKLTPPWFKKIKPILRYQNHYISPNDSDFELYFINVLQKVYAENFLLDFDHIYEFGSGSGFQILSIAKHLPRKHFYGVDWSDAIINIMAFVDKTKGGDVDLKDSTFWGGQFDFFNPDLTFILNDNAAVITFCALEQMGSDFKELLKYFLMQKNVTFIHLEPSEEFYNGKTDFMKIASEYSIHRNYLNGYYSELKKLDNEGVISLAPVLKLLGSRFHDGWNLFSWKKI